MTERDAIIRLTSLVRSLAYLAKHEIGTESANRIAEECDDIVTGLFANDGGS